MAVANLKPLPRFSTIGHLEKRYLERAMKRPLSGYLGGIPTGGYWVERLSTEWADTFKIAHAVPCNSATSGLLAACMAAGIGPDSTVWTTAYSMSATAACAKVLGAHIVFIDIETVRFSMNMNNFVFKGTKPKAIIVTNLFGHPAYLSAMRSWCDSNKVIMIEDNAQSPFAMENGIYAGTIGHMGVFSFNIHKALQAGEGGVIITNDSELHNKLCGAINHGELGGSIIGLNLRMTEPTAAIACAQLSKAKEIIDGRRAIAHALTEMVWDISWIDPPVEDIDCFHVYYMWAAKVTAPEKRMPFVEGLINRGFPIRPGYTTPLPEVFGHKLDCYDTIRTEGSIITYEVCAYDPKTRHLKQMREIIKEVAEEING